MLVVCVESARQAARVLRVGVVEIAGSKAEVEGRAIERVRLNIPAACSTSCTSCASGIWAIFIIQVDYLIHARVRV